MVKHSVIDLFCGIGGLTHGFKLENFKVTAGFDIDESCKFAYECNNSSKFYTKDLSVVDPSVISEKFIPNTTKILVGCAPCQAFSIYTQGRGNSEKWKMLYSFSRIISEVQPDVISMENVPNLKNYKKGKVLNDFINKLESLGYHVNWKIVNAADYGVPQSRKRLILFASRFGKVEFYERKRKTKYKTVRDTIGHLPPILDGESHPSDPMHRSRRLSELNKKRIIATPEGGGWKNWPRELVLECHKNEKGKSFGSVYGRMTWDAIGPTMTTQCTGLGNGRFGHPVQDRAISLREASLLQTFPETYQFYNPKEEMSTPKIQMHIGNAVPVKLGQMVAKTIRLHLKKYVR